MAEIDYPKVTQENMLSASQILIGALSDPEFLQKAPYSNLMLKTINQQVLAIDALVDARVNAQMERVLAAKEAEANPPPPEPTDEEITEDIHKQFKEIADELEDRNGEYRDNFNILVRIEKTIRTIEKIATSGSSDTVKLSATNKLIDFQEDQLKILERLMNLEKAQKIEAVTRRFFQEIRKFDKLEDVADRYLKLIQDID